MINNKLINPYSNDDSLPDTVKKNKDNILGNLVPYISAIVKLDKTEVLTDMENKTFIPFKDWNGKLISYSQFERLWEDFFSLQVELENGTISDITANLGTNRVLLNKASKTIQDIKKSIDTNSTSIDNNKTQIDINTIDINRLKTGTHFRGTFATEAEILALPNPKKGDYALLGTENPYTEYIYDSEWEIAGIKTENFAERNLANVSRDEVGTIGDLENEDFVLGFNPTTGKVGKKQFIEKYKPTRNSNLLIENDETATASANIGTFYRGAQYYGDSAKGPQYYGKHAEGYQRYGYSASGPFEIGQTATGSIPKLYEGNGGKRSVTFKQIVDTVSTPTTQKSTNLVKGVDFNTFDGLIQLVDEHSLYCITLGNEIIIGRISNSSLTNAQELYMIGIRQRVNQDPNSHIVTTYSGIHTIKNDLTVERSDNKKSFSLVTDIELNRRPDGFNYFKGTFKDELKLLTFLNSESRVEDNFLNNDDSSFTTLGMPNLSVVGKNSFSNIFIYGIVMPKLHTIKESGFENSFLTQINYFGTIWGLPNELTYLSEIQNNGLNLNRLKELHLPNIVTLGDNSLGNKNLTFEKVTLPKKFNTTTEKDRIFGVGYWTNITFTWV